MSGRRSHYERDGGGSEQGRKPARGNARGHGAYHRHERGRGAPRKVASGKDRTMDTTRRQQFGRLGEDELAELSAIGHKSDIERSIEESGEAAGYGVDLEGHRAHGVVVE